ncbi:MAG: hypothetical protein M1549_02090 [Candidatus Dependentiae bacterium]|nr:hypothetical protein [Candidatus Dependentiae bacterium]
MMHAVKWIWGICCVVAVSLSGFSEYAEMLYREGRVILMAEAPHVTAEQVRLLAGPGRQPFVCDFYLEGAEAGTDISGGYWLAGVFNIDHHAPTARMAREITATHLAIEYVCLHGPISGDGIVVINHTDCDSILSTLIMLGVLPPEDRFAAASLAADHTGEKNGIADLLQVLQARRDFCDSVRNLDAYLSGFPLSVAVQDAVEERCADRRYILSAPQVVDGCVTCLLLGRKLDAGLFAAQFPGAIVIMGIAPFPGDPSRLYITVRRGQRAPECLYLNQLNVGPEFGGRWNALANRRGGGSIEPYERIVQRLNAEIKRFLQAAGISDADN